MLLRSGLRNSGFGEIRHRRTARPYVELAHSRHPYKSIVNCLLETSPEGSAAKGLVVAWPDVNLTHPINYYFRRIQPWIWMPAFDPSALRAERSNDGLRSCPSFSLRGNGSSVPICVESAKECGNSRAKNVFLRWTASRSTVDGSIDEARSAGQNAAPNAD
jgi:hypothetical protein